MQTSSSISVSKGLMIISALLLCCSSRCEGQDNKEVQFEYKEAYLPENIDPRDSKACKMNNVDIDWGLWGHHLSKAIGKDAPESAYALIDGSRNHEQYCFSSEDTYSRIVEYIVENFGDGKKQQSRFAIIPNDNGLACTCESCRKAGNTPGNATPAVTGLVNRLAKRFPGHLFFTSSYLSTETPPAQKMAPNTGVIISAMGYPLMADGLKHAGKFTGRLEEWKKVCGRIYIWDYISDFDDYFTPFPVLSLIRDRLRYYESQGIKGVFLNGSGENYSTFSGLDHYVLCTLLSNPDADVSALVKDYFDKGYPVSGKTLEKYCLQLESKAMSSRKRLNIYGGIDDAMKSYLDPEAFMALYKALPSFIVKSSGSEREKLGELYCSLSYTALEISRTMGTGDAGCLAIVGGKAVPKPETYEYLKELGRFAEFRNMGDYKEADGKVAEYVEDWKTIMKRDLNANLLTGGQVKSVSPLDEDYEDLSCLTDNVPGLPSNYHCGWLVSSICDTIVYKIQAEKVGKAKKFEAGFLYCPRFGFYPPEKVEISVNGNIIKSLTINYNETELTDGYAAVQAASDIILPSASDLMIRIVKNKTKGKLIGCDELLFY